MTDSNPYIRSLLAADPLREPTLRAIIQALNLPMSSRGLDVGCGIGLQALLLAQSIGPQGHVTGLDIDLELLAYGAGLAKNVGLTGRITFRQGDMQQLPFDAATFDWVWSADCVGYPIGDLAQQLPELMRVTKPGGQIILLAWTSQQVLPGYPLLEAQLNATCSSYQPYLQGKDPELHFLRAARWVEAAGLQNVTARTFLGEVQAPLSAGERGALTALFKMLWVEPSNSADSAAWSEYQRVCTPESPDFILNVPGYYAFFTYTVFHGQVPQR